MFPMVSQSSKIAPIQWRILILWQDCVTIWNLFHIRCGVPHFSTHRRLKLVICCFGFPYMEIRPRMRDFHEPCFQCTPPSIGVQSARMINLSYRLLLFLLHSSIQELVMEGLIRTNPIVPLKFPSCQVIFFLVLHFNVCPGRPDSQEVAPVQIWAYVVIESMEKGTMPKWQ